MLLKAPEVEICNGGLTVAFGAAAALVAALVGRGVVGLGDLCTVSIDC